MVVRLPAVRFSAICNVLVFVSAPAAEPCCCCCEAVLLLLLRSCVAAAAAATPATFAVCCCCCCCRRCVLSVLGPTDPCVHISNAGSRLLCSPLHSVGKTLEQQKAAEGPRAVGATGPLFHSPAADGGLPVARCLLPQRRHATHFSIFLLH